MVRGLISFNGQTHGLCLLVTQHLVKIFGSHRALEGDTPSSYDVSTKLTLAYSRSLLGAFERWLGSCEVRLVESPNEIRVLIKRGRHESWISFFPCAHQKRSWEGTVRRWLSANQEENSHQELSKYIYLEVPASSTLRNKCELFQPLILWHFINGSLSWLTQSESQSFPIRTLGRKKQVWLDIKTILKFSQTIRSWTWSSSFSVHLL